METCCHSNSSEKPSVNTDVKISKGVNNNNNSLNDLNCNQISVIFQYMYIVPNPENLPK